MTFTYKQVEHGISLVNYKGSETCLIIPSEIDGYPVVCIEQDCFVEHGDQIEEIEVPGTIEVLKSGSFDGCYSLQRVLLNEGLRILETDFLGGSHIHKVSIPKTVTFIGNIARSAMIYEIDPNNKHYYSDGFGLYRIEEDGNYTLIGIHPNKHIASYTICNTCTRIESEAFYNREDELKEVSIPDTCVDIEEGAFQSTNYSYQRLRGIDTYIVSKTHPTLTYEEDCLVLHKNKECILLANTSLNTRVTIPNTITIIGSYAFLNRDVKELLVPIGVKEIHKDAFLGSMLNRLQFAKDGYEILFPKVHDVLRDELLEGIGDKQPFYNYSIYENRLLRMYISSERVRLIVGRLTYDRDLSEKDRLEYQHILTSQMDTAFQYICERHDLDTLYALLKLSLMSDEDIDRAIEIATKNNCVEETALLISHQQEHRDSFGFDFSL